MYFIAEKLGFACRRLVISLLFLNAILLLLHIVEIVLVVKHHNNLLNSTTIFTIFWNNVMFISWVAVLMGIPYMLMYLISDFVSRMLFAICIILIIITHIGLSQYYITAETLLGADLWNYSYDDIVLTVKASTQIAWWQILGIPLLIGFVMRMHYYFQQRTLNLKPTLIVYLTFIGIFLVDNIGLIPALADVTQRNLAAHKSAYFYTKTYQYLKEQSNDDGIKPLYASESAFPFQIKQDTVDYLGDYLQKTDTPPNFVFVLVEGLGRAFTGPQATYGGAMPFLDSLSQRGLYWSNFLTTTGRTFGILPSILGSLPYGASGFMEMGKSAPFHTSLIQLLKANGYYTGYFYGGDARFDGQRTFLEGEGIHQIFDEYDFPSSYEKMPLTSENFTWGYPDKAVYDFSFQATGFKSPYLKVYLTLSTHEPFKLKELPLYNQRFNQLAAKLNNVEVNQNANAFKTLMYADDALRSLLANYAKLPEFKRTIFIITGDHRMIPVRHKNDIDRYHVPLLIYSPLLKNAQQFKSLSSHADVPATVVSYLRNNYQLQFPDSVHWLGSGLSFIKEFGSTKQLAIMKNKGDISEYVYGTAFLSSGDLYEIKDNLELTGNRDEELKETTVSLLNRFKELNAFVCKNNVLYNTIYASTINDIGHWHADSSHNIIDEKPIKVKELPTNTASSKEEKKSKQINKQVINQNETTNKINKGVIKGEAFYIRGKVAYELKEFSRARLLLQQALDAGYVLPEVYRVFIKLELDENNQTIAMQWLEKAEKIFGREVFKQERKLLSK